MLTPEDLEVALDYAVSFMHVPYKWGGNNSLTGIDCSGFVCEFLRAVGLLKKGEDLTAQEIFNRFQLPEFGTSCIQGERGNLVFYGKSINEISHVAILLTRVMIVEAGGGDRKTSTLEDAKAKGAAIRVRKIDYRGDLKAIVRPNYA